MFIYIKRIRLVKKKFKGKEKWSEVLWLNVLFVFWWVGCGVRVNKIKLLLMVLDFYNDGFMFFMVYLIIKKKFYEFI